MIKIQKYIFIILLIFAYFFPLFVSLKSILEGSIPFWYDPARDMLQALDNLKKITLIGPTGGIPGIFYGPHWTWFQSIPLYFTRDPRYVALVVLILPYYLGFACLLYKLSKNLGKINTLFLWLLFMYGFRNYTTYLWQPHLAPVFILGAVYILLSTDLTKPDKKTLPKLFASGVILGLLVNFHISFGVGVVIGSLLFLLLENLQKDKKQLLVNMTVYLTGVLIVFIPNILFEFRHDFLQTKAIWHTLTQAVLYNSAVVGQVGLKPGDILYSFFFSVPESITTLRNGAVILFYLAGLIYFFYFHKRRDRKPQHDEDMIIRYIVMVSFTVLAIYLSSRNPVWSYHFVGVETLWLLFIGFMIKKLRISNKIITLVFILVAAAFVRSYYEGSKVPALSISSLYTKEYVVDRIFEDSNTEPFIILAYSPAIYTYDYDYLFQWMGREKYGFVPEKEVGDANLVYLIVPNQTEVVEEDFTNKKTPNKLYKTVKKWKIEDGTAVIKRVKI